MRYRAIGLATLWLLSACSGSVVKPTSPSEATQTQAPGATGASLVPWAVLVASAGAAFIAVPLMLTAWGEHTHED